MANRPADPYNLTDQPVFKPNPFRPKPADGQLRDTNPKTQHGIKKPPLSAIPPVAILHLGGAMANGEAKYGKYNWREHAVSATVYLDAMFRHMLEWQDGRDIDAESGQHPLAHVMACCAIVLDAISCGKLIDDRGIPGNAHDYIERHRKQFDLDFVQDMKDLAARASNQGKQQ